MHSYFVKQPDGRLAVFSTAVNLFTFTNMTEAEALAYGRIRWGEASMEMVAQGVDDRPIPHTDDPSVDGMGRWKFALTAIASKHGIDGIRKALDLIGLRDGDIPQVALDAALAAARQ